MIAGVEAVLYDGVSSRPLEARVSVHEPSALVVEHGAERFTWPLEHKGLQWERTRDTLRITFGGFPRRVLIVRDPLFIKSFVLRMRYTGRQGVYDRLLGVARSGPVLFFLGVAVLLVASYVWLLPWAAEGVAVLLPRSVDRQLGEAAWGTMMHSLDEDTACSRTLQRFGDALQLSPDHPLTFHVVRDEQVNAFALPGGHIVVFTGILERMDRPEELAALLAHEGTHVQERHSTRMLMRQLASYVFLSLIIGDASAIAAVVAEHADNVRNLSYSRGLESDADRHGMARMHARGVDPQGMVDLLKLLQEEAAGMPAAKELLSSHPLTEDRIAEAEDQARHLGPVAAARPPLDTLFTALKQERP